MMYPSLSREMPSCSAIDLGKIRRSSNFNSWIFSTISVVFSVLGLPGRDVTEMTKSRRFYWTTLFWRWHKMVCSPNISFRIAWFSFRALHCWKSTCWKLASRCCWNRALLLTCFISASLRRTDLQFGTPRRVRHFTWQQWGYFEICVVLMFVIQYMYKYLKRNMTDKRDQSVDFETILQCWKIVRTHYTKAWRENWVGNGGLNNMWKGHVMLLEKSEGKLIEYSRI